MNVTIIFLSFDSPKYASLAEKFDVVKIGHFGSQRSPLGKQNFDHEVLDGMARQMIQFSILSKEMKSILVFLALCACDQGRKGQGY